MFIEAVLDYWGKHKECPLLGGDTASTAGDGRALAACAAAACGAGGAERNGAGRPSLRS